MRSVATRPFLPASVTLLVLVVFGAAEVMGQAPARQDGVEIQGKILTRVYDVGEIVHTTRNYAYTSSLLPPTLMDPRLSHSGAQGGGNLFGGGGSMPSADDAAGRVFTQRMELLIKLLTDTVSPDTWRDNGGNVGTIQSLGHRLVITQTDVNHDRIAQLLEDLRKASPTSRTVTILAEWVLLLPDQVDSVVKRTEQGRLTRQVDPNALAKLGPDLPRHRGRVSCLDGQTVHIASGNGYRTVSEMSPVVGHVAAFDPQVQMLHAGAVLQVTPQMDLEGRTALLDVHSIVSDRREPGRPIRLEVSGERVTPATQPGPSGVTSTTAEIDRLNVVSQQLQTTLRVPLGTPVLAGGMTLEPTADGDRRQLYLIVEVTTE